MPKKLILCRHAQAEPPLYHHNDFDRNLTSTGVEQAKQAGEWLVQNQTLADLVTCSQAPRALQTAHYLAAAVKTKQVLSFLELYEATPTQLLAFINELPASANHVLLVGHNPGLSYIAGYLTGLPFGLETCQLVVISLETNNWAEVSGGMGAVEKEFAPLGL